VRTCPRNVLGGPATTSSAPRPRPQLGTRRARSERGRRRADVGITGEVVAAIGELSQAVARRVIDATGLIVSPGFIDTHTHAEGGLLVDPQHANGIRQGIT
jgi:cytosine/adenosine deaminase-related metal-dependent hydrolase